MIGNIRTPLPSLANGFARTPERSCAPHLRKLMGVGRKGLVGSCNPCLGVQGANLLNLGRQSESTLGTASKQWVQSPIGPAVVINEAAEFVGWSAANNDDFQFNDAYSEYEITLHCFVRVHSSTAGAGVLFHSDNQSTGNVYGHLVWVDESTRQLRALIGNGTSAPGGGYYATASNAVTLGVWTHILMVWGENLTYGAPEFWVDGKRFQTTLTGSGNPLANLSGGTTRIGRSSQLGGSSKMDLADWAVWNTELTNEQIAPLIADPLCYLRARSVCRGRGRGAIGRIIRADDCVFKLS